MGSNKRARGRREKRRSQADLNPFPGITGEGAEANRSFGDKTKGVFGDGLDGTLGDVSEEQRARAVGDSDQERRQREYGMASGTSIHPISDLWPDGGDVGDGRTGGQGLPRRSDKSGTGGGVAVSGGRGSDVGTAGGEIEEE